MTARWLALGLLAGIALWSATGCQPTPSGAQRSNPETAPVADSSNELFPDFTVKGLDGQSVSLNQYRGQVIILDLFATWCPPCRMEIPHFVALQKEFAGQMTVVGLAYDQVPAAKIKAFSKELGINYPVYWGSEEIAQHVGLRGIPHTLVIDQEGRVAKSLVGYHDKAVFEKLVRELLKSKKTAPPEPA